MAKIKDVNIEYAFYKYLWQHYKENKGIIRKSYKQLTKKFLDFNNPENGTAFLRKPQFEALEIYVFLKEYLNNTSVQQIFDDWYNKNEPFEARRDFGIEQDDSMVLFDSVLIDTNAFKQIFNNIKQFQQSYTNYIFALTMGIGKTILMATTIFYEFLLANKFPHDERYCHNALVFAPDTTVLQSLKEIITFDKSKVVPTEYVNWLETNLHFHFLDESGISLNLIDNSDFNIIISNTQKIILKKRGAEKTATQRIFNETKNDYSSLTMINKNADLYDDDIESEVDLATNQRFEKLLRLNKLGIYVDEAHHAFGTTLEKDFGMSKSTTSLRLTINELAAQLTAAGTKVVACYNFTGTPYVKNKLLPEVVYAYGLKDAIDKNYLKHCKVKSFTNTKSKEFISIVINDFWETHKDLRYESMLPKIAFFASTIDELENELRPAVEESLIKLGIPLNKILINVGDEKLTTNDDIREFINLDTISSEKQFILLVNKGKEGWNCRSLFSVGLFRKPKSKIFVLQATMRCLRAIGEVQEEANVYLSEENMSILEDELQDNFRMSLEEFNRSGNSEKDKIQVRKIPPSVKISIKRVNKLHRLVNKAIKSGIDFNFNKEQVERYKIIKKEWDIEYLLDTPMVKEDVTVYKTNRDFSELTLVAEIARYLNKSPLEISTILKESKDGITKILDYVNHYNEMLYDVIIPKLFNELFELKEYIDTTEEELELVKDPPNGREYYEFKAKPELIASITAEFYKKYKDKSFNLDNYCFDSKPEMEFFNIMLEKKEIEKVYFTGMMTQGQTEFLIPYIDPESHALRNYYPDFVIRLKDGSWFIVEVKSDYMIDDSITRAKADYASNLASQSNLTYIMLRSSKVHTLQNISFQLMNEERD